MANNKSEGVHSHVGDLQTPSASEPALEPDVAMIIDQGDGAVLFDVGAKNLELGEASALRLANDGHTVLIPQPSDDPNDPLNWSWWKKHSILLTIAACAFVADFQAGAAAPCIVVQGVEWHITPTHVNYANNLNVLFVGIGGVVGMPFLFFWGRAPVVFWVTLCGTFFTLGCTLAPSFPVYYGMKAMQGFTLTAAQTAGLAFIQDMFFMHEQARKIGLWTAVFLTSPYFGPLFGNFILAGTGDWRNVYWLVFGIGCLDVLLCALFLDETWYRRDLPIEKQPARGNRLLRITGIWQIQVHDRYFGTFVGSVQRLVSVFIKPIMVPVMIFYGLTFMWGIGINQTSSILFVTPIAVGGYGFSQNAVGFLFFAPIVGVVLGEIFGHFFNDFVAGQYIRKHAGVFVPEARLSPIYLAALFEIPGLIIVGQALGRHLNYSAIVVGWGMYVFGYMVASVAIVAYVLDSYPTASGEVSSFINLARTLAGFTVGYFQLQWATKDGYAASFGVQAAVVAIGVMIIPFIHIFGARMRAKGGPLRF